MDLQEAIALFEAGEPRQAADLLERMAAEMPGYATARVLLARSYERMNDWQPALRAWREAHQIIPNSPVVRRGLQRAARKAASRSPIEHGRPTPPRAEPAWEHVQDIEEEPQESEAAYEEQVGTAHTEGVETEADAPEPPEDRAPEPPELEAEPATAEPESRPLETEPPDAERSEREYEDLDRLISELESARIVPRPDVDSVPPPDLEDDIEDVVSETLARIYASQGQYDEAAHVYELLADQQPDKAEEFGQKASEMRSRASEQE